MNKTEKICVFSEIAPLKKVLVHTPGEEIQNIHPSRLEELLFGEILVYDKAIAEHKKFIAILEQENVEVIQLVDLVLETYKLASEEVQNQFLEDWLLGVKPTISNPLKKIELKNYLLNLSSKRNMIQKMMAGIFYSELPTKWEKEESEFIADPMPNLTFVRDPFASIGRGVSINQMKYATRKRETLFFDFIFTHHPEYQKIDKLYTQKQPYNIEGGDIFIYNAKTLVFGVSERTEVKAILAIAHKIQTYQYSFEKIYAINVPKMKNLMHLDVWLTMVDYDKFVYSPNMIGELQISEINLLEKQLTIKNLNLSLAAFLKLVIAKEPILIPVGGWQARQLDIDVETKFDATNYLVIKPSVVVGYARNQKTNQALRNAGIKVHTFEGDQLSLAMGSARCLSMPLVRENKK